MKLRNLVLIGICIILLGSLILYDASTNALTRLNVKTINLKSDEINDTFNGFTLVYFSDTHLYNQDEAYFKSVMTTIQSLGADVILFGGDLIDKDYYPRLSSTQRTSIIEALTSLSAPYGKYAVLGDDDQINQADISNLLYTSNFELITNQVIQIHQLGADYINLIGAPNQISDFDQSLGDSLIHFDYSILLSYDPSILDQTSSDYDLILSGKTHGGQVVLPLIGPLYDTNSPYLKDHYKKHFTELYISNGVGVDGFKMRLWKKPDILLIRLLKN
jgi:uncharacterized protein